MGMDRLADLEAALADAVEELVRIVYYWNVLDEIRVLKAHGDWR